MTELIAGAGDVWDRLAAGTPAPDLPTLGAAIVVGVLLVLWGPTARVADQLQTIAHEGGHAVAAVLTGRRVHRVHVNADGSGSTTTAGRARGFGPWLVSFAGYPFPGLLGAALLVAAVSGSARLWAGGCAFALLLLLLRMRNLHGWLVVALLLAGVAAAVWYLPGAVLATGLAVVGSVLLAGSVRSLIHESRGRRRGQSGSDVWALAQRGSLPATAYWLAMLSVIAGCGFLAWRQLAGVYGFS